MIRIEIRTPDGVLDIEVEPFINDYGKRALKIKQGGEHYWNGEKIPTCQAIALFGYILCRKWSDPNFWTRRFKYEGCKS